MKMPLIIDKQFSEAYNRSIKRKERQNLMRNNRHNSMMMAMHMCSMCMMMRAQISAPPVLEAI